MNTLISDQIGRDSRALPLHEEVIVPLATDAATAFAYLDDHRRFSSHMSKSSWRMGGAKMDILLDERQGQAVGSHIRLSGLILGIRLAVEEVVTERVVPARKEWSTIGRPRLLVIGHYKMGFEVNNAPAEDTRVRIFIDYEPPTTVLLGFLLRPLSRMYAKWCVDQMAHDAQEYFARSRSDRLAAYESS